MSFDVHVPIANDALTYGDCMMLIQKKWAALRCDAPLRLSLFWDYPGETRQTTHIDVSETDVAVSEKEAYVDIEFESSAAVRCTFIHAPFGPYDDEHTKLQVNVEAWRNRESQLIMMLVASCLANAAKAFVVDDWGYFHKGRIQPSELDATLASVADLPLSAAAHTLFGSWE